MNTPKQIPKNNNSKIPSLICDTNKQTEKKLLKQKICRKIFAFKIDPLIYECE